MFDRALPQNLAYGPYAERADPQEGALDRWLEGLIGRSRQFGARLLPKVDRLPARVLARQAVIAHWPDAALQSATMDLGRALRRGGLAPKLLVNTFAIVRETAQRSLGMAHYPVQILGAHAMLRGDLAEMQTGEGKTFTAAMTAAAAALAGTPVHVITVNDYLAQRDAESLAPLFRKLGLSVGLVQHGQTPAERRRAYLADITYCTNKEIGFDYLKDQLALPDWPSAARLQTAQLLGTAVPSQAMVLRGLHFAIVDEADSILIDEARTPLIIARDHPASDELVAAYDRALAFARHLERGHDYTLTDNQRQITVTPRGVSKIAAMSGPLPWVLATHRGRRELVTQALRALHLFARDTQYLIRDNKIQIIDEYTGRVMPDRSWERGLHQLIEMKEGCPITGHRETLARVTYQRFFRRYLHLCGMTGTATEVANELWAVYRLRVTRIDTHKPCLREVYPTRCVANEHEKWATVLDAVRAESVRKGRPILIGTRSVEASERVSAVLSEAGVQHQVLNARQDVEEAALIAKAGLARQVTVATNMAGRGTDIKLGPGVAERGGLHVVLTEWHEAKRIDRQLFGRAARQGDPGSCAAIVCLDDDIVQRYARPLLRVVQSLAKRRAVIALLRALVQGTAQRRHYHARQMTLRMDTELERLLAFAKRR